VLVKSLVAQGLSAPPPVVGLALVDTGASVSCVDATLPSKLGVKPTGVTQLYGATGGGSSSVYPMRVVIQGIAWTLDFQRLVEANLAPLGYVALLGRDVLSRMSLHYLGHVGEYTLAV
jgi:predicted aspartyl protease